MGWKLPLPLGLLVLLSALAVLSCWQAQQQGLEALTRTLNERAQWQRHSLQGLLKDTQSVLRQLASRNELRALDAGHCDPVQADIGRTLYWAIDLHTLDARAARVCPADASSVNGPAPQALLGLLARARGPGEVVAGAPFLDSLSGRWLIPALIRVGEAPAQGGLMVALQAHALQDRLISPDLPEPVVSQVVNAQGRVLLQSGLDTVAPGDIAPLMQVQETLAPGLRRVLDAGDNEWLELSLPIGLHDWWLQTRMPLQALNRQVAWHAAQWLVCAWVLAGLAWLAVALFLRRLLQPVRTLGEVAAARARGDSSARVPDAGPADIRRSVRQFNELLVVQQQHLDAVREEARRRDVALQGAQAGLWEWDIDVDVCWLAPQTQDLLGQPGSPVRVGARDWLRSLIHPEDLAPALRKFRAHVRHGRALALELRLRQRGDVWRWFQVRGRVQRDDSGQVVRVGGMLFEVHDHRTVRAELMNTAARMQAIVDHWPEGMLLSQGDWGSSVFCNPKAREWLGEPQGSGLALSRVEVQDRSILASHMAELACSGHVPADCRFRVRLADGAALTLCASSQEIKLQGRRAALTRITLAANVQAEVVDVLL